jgi:hypothetical protein
MRDQEPGIVRPTRRLPAARPAAKPTRWSRVARAGLSVVSLWLLLPTGTAAATPITLDDTSDHHWLLPEMELLVDASGALTVQEVAAAELGPISGIGGNEGDIVWLRATVHVPADAAASGEDWYLVIAPPFDPVTFYLEEDGAFRTIPLTHDPSGASLLVKLPGASGTHRFFVRLPLPLMLPSLFHVVTLTGLQRLEQRLLTQQGLYLGVIFAMLLVNLLMGLGLRDRTHLWYVAFVAAEAIYFSIQTGSVNRFLLPTATANELFRPGMACLVIMVAAGVQFSRRFLDTPRTAPRWDRVMRIYLGLAALAMLLIWLAPSSARSCPSWSSPPAWCLGAPACARPASTSSPGRSSRSAASSSPCPYRYRWACPCRSSSSDRRWRRPSCPWPSSTGCAASGRSACSWHRYAIAPSSRRRAPRSSPRSGSSWPASPTRSTTRTTS